MSLDEAVAAFDARDYGRASSLCARLLEGPDAPSAALLLSLIAARTGNSADATRHAGRAIALGAPLATAALTFAEHRPRGLPLRELFDWLVIAIDADASSSAKIWPMLAQSEVRDAWFSHLFSQRRYDLLEIVTSQYLATQPTDETACMAHLSALYWQAKIDRALEFATHRLANAAGVGPWLAHTIASLFAVAGVPGLADAIFRREFDLRTSHGKLTSTAILALGARFDAIVAHPAAPVPMAIEREASMDVPVVYFVGCDAVYAERYLGATVASLARNAGIDLAVHVHLINPTEASRAIATGLLLPATLTTETVSLSHLDPAAQRTWLASRRFGLLPALLERYSGRVIIVADVDQLVVRPLLPLLTGATWDVAMIHDPAMKLNLLSYFSATAVFIRPRPAARRFALEVASYVEYHVNKGKLAWHLDQAALVAAYLSRRGPGGLSVKYLPREILDSGSPTVSEKAVFWSVTASVNENATLTASDVYRQYAGPAR